MYIIEPEGVRKGDSRNNSLRLSSGAISLTCGSDKDIAAKFAPTKLAHKLRDIEASISSGALKAQNVLRPYPGQPRAIGELIPYPRHLLSAPVPRKLCIRDFFLNAGNRVRTAKCGRDIAAQAVPRLYKSWRILALLLDSSCCRDDDGSPIRLY